MATKFDVLTAEVKILKAENRFMRSEISLLNKRILERMPLATRPRGTYAAAAASFASVPGKQPSKSVPGKQALPSGAVSRSTEISDAAGESATTWADCDAPSASRRATGEIHEARPADPWIDDDGFTRVQRKRRPPSSSGTAKSDKVLAAPRKQVTKALFVSRLDPRTSVADIESFVAPFLGSKSVILTKLKPKFDSYASFHLSGDQLVLDIFYKPELWPKGSIFHPFFGRLDSSRVIVDEPFAAENV
ncbi:hypothetical protein HPB47_027828 [Ixodes persulcatus]|uniref:Uncharacterized protein n=1 Tax=Ixodes persulcatus TaxID=34615 RepID=A0AC60PUX8_IXOPE|nr:hypothetical protein HPB47_027828 [Ixodes persulcatus]